MWWSRAYLSGGVGHCVDLGDVVGVDVDEVSHIEAYPTNAVLRDLTVIDTPGGRRFVGWRSA